MTTRLTVPAVALAGLCTALSTHVAAADTALAPVVVTGSRFETPQSDVPASLTVIDGDELRAYPAFSLPDLLRTHAGIQVRNLFGNLAGDSAVDIRGMGEASAGNVLVLVDGQRINPVDSTGINWGAIPRASIARIEILRGGGTVLYGDRAVGGVINIVTREATANTLSASAGLGSFGYRSLGIGGSASSPTGWYLRAEGNGAREDGYRNNSETDQNTASARIGYRGTAGLDVFADLTGWKDSNGLPSALFRAQYETDPRFTRTPQDFVEQRGYRARPGLRWTLSEHLSLDAEMAAEHHDDAFRSPTYTSDRSSDTYSFTPRLRWKHGLGGLPSVTVIGVDAYRGKVDARSASGFGPGHQSAEQDSDAVYALNTTSWTPHWSTTLGMRYQRVRQQAVDSVAAVSGEATRSRHAAEIGAQWRDGGTRVFGRIGQVFRFANTDELFGFDPFTFATIFAGDLRPQHGTHSELGVESMLGAARLQASVFRIDLSDEIGFDGTLFANVNLPRTRRDGVELEAGIPLGGGFSADLSQTFMRARFRDGANAGKRIPLVAQQRTTARLAWTAPGLGSHSLSLVRTGARPISADFANALDMLPAYTVVDWQSSVTRARWTGTLAIRNLTNRKYAEFGGYGGFPADYYYYPANKRAVYLTVRHDFN